MGKSSGGGERSHLTGVSEEGAITETESRLKITAVSPNETSVTHSGITAARLQDDDDDDDDEDDDDDDDKLICHGGASDWLLVRSSVKRPADRRRAVCASGDVAASGRSSRAMSRSRPGGSLRGDESLHAAAAAHLDGEREAAA
ncbi:hypothetical protein EYF80_034675 [Liparis tanakae]|uniref:Uncharacterized protein n=1 Tax=Liparis tanakae TaxID=230148 RepID=A0A4Z2GP85_9TELE|nr:hypothetical protein EYF80_034675 [Liparis tanakae]